MSGAWTPARSAVGVLSLGALMFGASACSEVECATPDYTRAECRVIAENGFARRLSASGVELRFQTVDAQNDDSWVGEGVFHEREGQLQARVAHLGEFAISLRGGLEDTSVDLVLSNVHPTHELWVGPAGQEQLIAPADTDQGTRRSLSVPVSAGELTWVRGRMLACPSVYRMVVLGDVQLNPAQFSRIIERIRRERDEADEAGERLLGALIPGDLTESSTDAEFRVFAELLEPVAVPFALTPGNHDIYDAAHPSYNQTFGPGNYAFNVCRTRVAMLDTGSGTLAPSIVGRLPELFADQGADNTLAVMHYPPYAGVTGAGWGEEDIAMITLGEFAHQGGDLILAGHAHMLDDLRFEVAGTPLRELIAGTAGAWQGAGAPIYGYLRLRFVADDIEACFVEVPPPGALPTETLPAGLEHCP